MQSNSSNCRSSFCSQMFPSGNSTAVDFTVGNAPLGLFWHMHLSRKMLNLAINRSFLLHFPRLTSGISLCNFCNITSVEFSLGIYLFSMLPTFYSDNFSGIQVGTNGYHTPNYLKNFTGQFFAYRGYLTAFDNPYSGALTPLGMYEREPRLSAIMIELNRSLYMDTETGIETAGFGKLKTCLDDYLATIDEL